MENASAVAKSVEVLKYACMGESNTAVKSAEGQAYAHMTALSQNVVTVEEVGTVNMENVNLYALHVVGKASVSTELRSSLVNLVVDPYTVTMAL